MSEQPKCEHCGSTNIEYWEKMKSWRNVIDIAQHEVRIGKKLDDDVYESGFMCTDCLKEQPELSDYKKGFLS